VADIVVDTTGLSAIGDVDEASGTIRVEAGVLGSTLEAVLATQGLTLGHYPQSLTTSTVGGWLATRATGQASALYGGIERLVCGIECVLPSGEYVTIPPRVRPPGLDALALMCGSEGSLGVIVAATLIVAPQPSSAQLAASFASFESGLAAQRELARSRLPIAVLRLLNARESIDLAPDGRLAEGRCLLLGSIEGEASVVRTATRRARELIRSAGGEQVASKVVRRWWETRFAVPGLIESRNAAEGAMFDTIDLGVLWGHAGPLAAALEASLASRVDRLWIHTSHVYPHGTGIYVAFWLTSSDDAAAVARCREIWRISLALADKHKATYAHHHGIGHARGERYRTSPEGRIHALIKLAIDPLGVLVAGSLENEAPAVSTEAPD
jgi:alkyldihydroxyacetonephosphate synthase